VTQQRPSRQLSEESILIRANTGHNMRVTDAGPHLVHHLVVALDYGQFGIYVPNCSAADRYVPAVAMMSTKMAVLTILRQGSERCRPDW
jgi:hypothetical protein